LEDVVTISTGNLCLRFSQLEEFSQKAPALTSWKAFVVTNDLQLSYIGVVEGYEQLKELLEKCGIDHWRISFEEYSLPVWTACELSPELIVNKVKRRVQKPEELDLKNLEGVPLTEDEKTITEPWNFAVCSSSVQTGDGLKRLLAWFQQKKAQQDRGAVSEDVMNVASKDAKG
jgi:hypothetical protein